MICFISANEAKANADKVCSRSPKNVVFDMIRDASKKGSYSISVQESIDFMFGEDRRNIKRFFESLGYTVDYKRNNSNEMHDNTKYYDFTIKWDKIPIDKE